MERWMQEFRKFVWVIGALALFISAHAGTQPFKKKMEPISTWLPYCAWSTAPFALSVTKCPL